jgi:hypothetical protein
VKHRRHRAMTFVVSALTIAVVGFVPHGSPARADGAAPAPVLVWRTQLPTTVDQSSPVPVDLTTPGVAVGGTDGKVYVLDMATGQYEPGWPQPTSNPIRGTISAADLGNGTDTLFVPSGTDGAGQCSGGGMYAFDATGHVLWHNIGADNYQCHNEAFVTAPVIGSVTASGRPAVIAGALGDTSPAYDAVSGAMLPGWPFVTADTVFATPALIQAGGATDLVWGSDAPPGGPFVNPRGGYVAEISGIAQRQWQFDTDEVVHSSPAVGDIDGNGQDSIAFGTGNFFEQFGGPGGAPDSTKLFVLNAQGQLRWSSDLGALTMAGPALADLTGDGHADVIEPTYQAGTNGNPAAAGEIWAFDAAGNPLPGWAGRPSGGSQVLGSVATADLEGDGAQDVIVATDNGVFAYDGKTAAELFSLDQGVYFQTTPLVTTDANGLVGITLVAEDGVVDHWEMPASSHATLGTIGWPMFHHDARHTGNLVPPPLAGVDTASPVVGVAGASGGGDWAVRRDGVVASSGDAASLGSVVQPLAEPIVGMAATPDGRGYWLVASDGGVFSFGDAVFHGSTGALRLNEPIVGMAATPDGGGYWLVASDGGVFGFGDAVFHGSTGALRLNEPIVGIAATPDGGGYWLAASDGGVFNFGDARFLGSLGGAQLPAPIVGITSSPSGFVLAGAGGTLAAFP